MRFTKLVQDYPITLTVGVNGILLNFAAAFTQPTFVTFSLLFTGAVLVRGRHTVTRMIVSAGIRASHHARFHRFFSKARWEMDHLWRGLVKLIDRSLIPEGTVVRVGVDDTAQRKTGAKIYGVGMVHDNRPAARKGWDLSWGLTWVVTTIMVELPIWRKHVFALPVCARLYRKKKVCRRGKCRFRTKSMLALEMIEKLVWWLPGRKFLLHVDGGFATGSLLRELPANVEVIGRLRRDAALYKLPPKRCGKRGRPRRRGRRMVRPGEYAARRFGEWHVIELGNAKQYEVKSWVALWWRVLRERPVRVVAVRPVRGGRIGSGCRAQFLFTTDLSLSSSDVVEAYSNRWSIECMFHEAKERMGFEAPQCWTERAVERTAPFLLWVMGVVEYWFLAQRDGQLVGWRPRWRGGNGGDVPPSFSDMLAAMRREILSGTFLHRSTSKDELHKNIMVLIESAAFAA